MHKGAHHKRGRLTEGTQKKTFLLTKLRYKQTYLHNSINSTTSITAQICMRKEGYLSYLESRFVRDRSDSSCSMIVTKADKFKSSFVLVRL